MATPPFWPVERSFLIVLYPGILKLCILLRNVSFRAITSIIFSFKYNSSSLHFGLIPCQFQNKMFVPMKLVKGIPIMVEDALRWPTMGETYFEVLDCLGQP